MTTGQSKPEKTEAEVKARAEQLAQKHKISNILTAGMCFNVYAWLMMIPARPEMILRVSGGNAGVASQTLASMTGAAALVEFFAAGLCGRLSDSVGRRPVMLAAPLIAACARLVTTYGADRGRAWVVGANWFDRCFSGSAFPVYFGANGAALADLWMQDEDQTQLPKLGAKIAGLVGLGVALAPFTGAQVMQRTGSPKYVALLASFVSWLHLAYVYRKLPETLPAEQRKPFNWGGAQPFAFLQFFNQAGTRGLRMRLLAAAIFVKALTADMHDTRMVLLKTKLGFGPSEIGQYMLGSGGSVMASGAAGAFTVSKLGLVKHTYLGAVAAMCEQLMWSTATSARQIFAACAFGILAGGASAGTGQLLSQLAVAGGIGRGQVGAMMSNMNTVVKVPGPLIFATLFGKLGQSAPFQLAAALILASASIYSTVDKTPVDMVAVAKAAAEKAAAAAAAAGKDDEKSTPRTPEEAPTEKSEKLG